MKFNLTRRKEFVLAGALALAAVWLLSLAPITAHAVPLAQSGNLLQNPGMEQPYKKCGAGDTASGWACWYRQIDKPSDASALTYTIRPQFSAETDPSGSFPELIHGDVNSQHIGYQQDPWMAGIQQTVSNIPAGSVVQFCGYSRMRASNRNLGAAPSDGGVQGRARVGIDPNGGGNWASGVTWSGTANPHDMWQQLCVQATVGDAGKVSVFTSNDFREYARAHLDVWWDDFSLTVIGAATPAPGATSAPQAQPTSLPPAAPLPSVTSTPRPDGSIVHVVQSGDTLFALSIAYNVSIDQILALNNITKDSFLSIGQQIIMRGPTGSGPTQPGATSAPITGTAQPETTPTPAPTATPEQVNAKLCVFAFDDINADGLLASGEQPVAGVTFTVSDTQSGQSVATYTSDSGSAPHCFDNLSPGTYSVAVQPAPNTVATSDRRWSVSLTGGSTVNIRFGSKSDSSGASSNATPAPSGSGSGSSLSGLLLGGIGLVILLVAGVLGAFVIARRRA